MHRNEENRDRFLFQLPQELRQSPFSQRACSWIEGLKRCKEFEKAKKDTSLVCQLCQLETIFFLAKYVISIYANQHSGSLRQFLSARLR